MLHVQFIDRMTGDVIQSASYPRWLPISILANYADDHSTDVEIVGYDPGG